jgi:FeS assembly SUF system protein
MSAIEWLNQKEPQPQPALSEGTARRYISVGRQPSPEPPLIPVEEAIAAGFPGMDASDVPKPAPAPEFSRDELEEMVIAALRTVFDPEIPVNIYDLGLIYGLTIDPQQAHVDVRMTLTAPGCPVAQTFPGEVEQRMREVPGIDSAHVELVWDPPWTRERMSESVLLTLGML